MKTTITIAVAALLLGSCKKEKTTQTPTQQPATTKVWCIYSNFAGNKAYLDCVSTQEDFNQKMQQYSQPGLTLYPSYDIKTTCAECQ
jgi:hypothetical protein